MWVFPCLVSPAEFCGLALVNIWRFSKSTRPRDQQVTGRNKWGLFTLTHNPTKFDDIGLVKLEMYLFANIMWSVDRWAKWLDGRGQLNLSHTLAKIGGHCPSESKDKALLAYHMITWLMSHVTRWVRITELNNKSMYVIQISARLCYKLG